MRRRPLSFRARIAVIAVVGLAARLVYVFGPARNVKGFGDFYFYHWGANLIAAGHWFVEPFEYMDHGRLVASAVHPPLWELLLSGVSWLGGTSLLAHRAFGCLVGAVTIALVGLLGRRIGGDRTGVVAAALAAVYPVLIAADGSLMSESLYGMLVAAALLLALDLRVKPDVRRAAALGAVIALAALTRSEGLILLVLLALPVALVKAPPGGASRAAACLAAAALVLTPWLVREWSEFGQPVLISTNSGPLLAGANCDLTYRGLDIGLSSTRCYTRTIANEADQAARWRSQAVDYMSAHAARVPVVMGVRVLRTFDLYQPWRMVRFAEGRWSKADKAGVIAYYLLLPFALAGGWLIRRRRAELLILLAPVAVVIISTVVGYGFPRFRHAADLAIVVLAAVALARPPSGLVGFTRTWLRSRPGTPSTDARTVPR
jgi:4-amino-4-deoxy-L-arabinose transferase-like glycosyltransferase